MPLAWLRRLAKRAAARLGIDEEGVFAISFIDERMMRRLHGQFLHDRRSTDVLTFRYACVPAACPSTIGEILIAPSAAHRYANAHRLPYREELARYVVHGLLHWLGHDDRTAAQQRKMRALENHLLIQCVR